MVTWILLCRLVLEYTLDEPPCLMSRDTNVCRRSWNRTSRTPARSRQWYHPRLRFSLIPSDTFRRKEDPGRSALRCRTSSRRCSHSLSEDNGAMAFKSTPHCHRGDSISWDY